MFFRFDQEIMFLTFIESLICTTNVFFEDNVCENLQVKPAAVCRC